MSDDINRAMEFDRWWKTAPHRIKYPNDHPVYLAAKEAWDVAWIEAGQRAMLKERKYWQTALRSSA